MIGPFQLQNPKSLMWTTVLSIRAPKKYPVNFYVRPKGIDAGRIQPWDPNLRISEVPRTQQPPGKKLWVSECAQSCPWLTVSQGSPAYPGCLGHQGPSLCKQGLKEDKLQTQLSRQGSSFKVQTQTQLSRLHKGRT